MTAYLSITPDTPPKKFYRGQTLAFTMALPEKIQFGQLAGWTLESQLRRLENSGPAGFIADLEVTWAAGSQQTRVNFLYDGDTSDWPLGPAAFDVVFTGPDQKIRSTPIELLIVAGVTR